MDVLPSNYKYLPLASSLSSSPSSSSPISISPLTPSVFFTPDVSSFPSLASSMISSLSDYKDHLPFDHIDLNSPFQDLAHFHSMNDVLTNFDPSLRLQGWDNTINNTSNILYTSNIINTTLLDDFVYL